MDTVEASSEMKPAFRSLRSGAVGQSMRAMLEHRLISAEGEYRGALEQYRCAMRLQRRITVLENTNQLEEAERLKVRLMETLHKGSGAEGREQLMGLEREILAAEGGGGDLSDTGKVQDVMLTASDSDTGRSSSSHAKPAGAAGVVGAGAPKKRSSGLKRAMLLSICAWLVAFVGLTVFVVFLTKSYIDSRNNPVITRSFETVRSLDLPVMSICSTNSDVPSFADFPTDEYKGLPIFTLSEAEFLDTNDNYTTPLRSLSKNGTQKQAPGGFETRILGPSEEQCESTLARLNATKASESLGQVVLPLEDKVRCAQCITIGRDGAIPVMANRSEAGLPSGLSINVVMSRLYAFCFVDSVRNLATVQSLFVAELERNAKALVDAGILKFDDSVPLNDSEKVTTALWVQPGDQEDTLGGKEIDFYCNVYFFSGFFYPTEPKKPDVRYVHKMKFPQQWDRVEDSKGPYFELLRQPSIKKLLSQESLGLRPREDEVDTFSLLSTVALSIYAEDRDVMRSSESSVVNTTSLVAQIDRSKGALVRFRQQGSIGSASSVVRVATLSTTDDRPQESEEGAYFSNRLNFTYDRFLKEVLSEQQTYSEWQYIADLLEVLTLFTGLSFYSVLVVPATAFLVQRHRKRRRQAIQRALAESEPKAATSEQ